MTIELKMPALSPTMSEGKLARWLVKEGDSVASGDVVAEIETDKATMEFEVADDGVVGKILVADGTDGVAVNTPIAILLEDGEDASVIDAAPAAPKAEPAAAPKPAADVAVSPLAKRMAEEAGVDLASITGTGPEGKIVKEDVEAAIAAKGGAKAPVAAPAAAPAPASSGGRVFASPLARRMAEQAGIDLAAVKGSGPSGRIVKADIEAAKDAAPSVLPGTMPVDAPTPAAGAPAATTPLPGIEAPAASAPAAAGANVTEIPNSKMRQIIAKRLSESKQTAPHFYATVDMELDALLAMRKELNGRSPEGEGAYKLSVNDFIVRAVALAMRKVPAINVSWTDAAVLQYGDVDVSVAVSTPTGLITPIVRNADHKGLSAISGEMKDLAARARDGKLSPEEYQGGGFTVSNMGMMGVKSFQAIINPPQSAILAVGAGEQRPVVKDGALAIATVMSCTLSVDHRAVDGAVGAEFLAALKALIEEPLTMLL